MFLKDKIDAERIIQLRLDLWEYSHSHSIIDLRQKAMDGICELTNSPIGFYHDVNEDNESLTLQSWSTRTKKEFCKAEAEGHHYPISEAGVWVDCIIERKPVIHNDYLALPHRKGLPEGHAEVIRELVVPTFREGKIVSILGVGNKLAEYNEEDIILVMYVADVIWTIVEQKQMSNQIRELNAKLEQMSITDELTGLYNRRYFSLKGNEEIRHSNRYHSPLSFIMLDIDHFKRVNDSYGHNFGDVVLKNVSQILGDNIRDSDFLFRIGGEEFGVLSPEADLEKAIKLGERLRLAIENSSHLLKDDASIKVTISIGIAIYSKERNNLDDLMHFADQALYEAKHSGRNCVRFYVDNN